MARRGKHEGTITKRADGRYHGRIQIRNRRRDIYGKTRREVLDKIAAIRNSGGVVATGSAVTCVGTVSSEARPGFA